MNLRIIYGIGPREGVGCENTGGIRRRSGVTWWWIRHSRRDKI